MIGTKIFLMNLFPLFFRIRLVFLENFVFQFHGFPHILRCREAFCGSILCPYAGRLASGRIFLFHLDKILFIYFNRNKETINGFIR